MTSERRALPRSDKDWQKILADFAASGQTIREFCAAHEIPEKTFYRAKQRLNAAPAEATSTTVRKNRTDEEWTAIFADMKERGETLHGLTKRSGISNSVIRRAYARLHSGKKSSNVATKPAPQKDRTPEDWTRLVELQQASGQSIRVFAEAADVNRHSLAYHVTKHNNAKREATKLAKKAARRVNGSAHPVAVVESPEYRAVMTKAFEAAGVPAVPETSSFVPSSFNYSEVQIDLPGGIKVTYKR